MATASSYGRFGAAILDLRCFLSSHTAGGAYHAGVCACVGAGAPPAHGSRAAERAQQGV
jgi:hypothetical protein